MRKQILISRLTRQLIEMDSLDEAIAYLERYDLVPVQKILVPTFLFDKDYVKCQRYLDSIPNSSSEDSTYHVLFDMLLTFYESGNQLEDLSGQERQTVENVAASSTRVSAAAQSILVLLDDSILYRLPESVPSSKKGDEETLVDLNKEELIRIYPNPSSGDFTVSCSSCSSELSELVIYDVIGELLKTIPITSGKTNIKIKDLDAGVYFVVLKMNGEIKTVSKIILSE